MPSYNFCLTSVFKRFDLKGIQGRHVDEVKKSAELTLWDGDWVEGNNMCDKQVL
jgi:hypothetical protein